MGKDEFIEAYYISIPFGAIKRYGWQPSIVVDVISIPFGAIKRQL